MVELRESKPEGQAPVAEKVQSLMDDDKSPSLRRARGRWAEDLVSNYLQRGGYEVICRNYTCPGGELDIVAKHGDYLCFVEVRYRSSIDQGEPLETVRHTKRSRLVSAARHFLAHHSEIDHMRQIQRFDVVSVVGEDSPVITLVKNAFETSDGW